MIKNTLETNMYQRGSILKKCVRFLNTLVFLNILPPFDFKQKKTKTMSKLYYYFIVSIMVIMPVTLLGNIYYFQEKLDSSSSLFFITMLHLLICISSLNILHVTISRQSEFSKYMIMLFNLDALLYVKESTKYFYWIEITFCIFLYILITVSHTMLWLNNLRFLFLSIYLLFLLFYVILSSFAIGINAIILEDMFICANLKLKKLNCNTQTRITINFNHLVKIFKFLLDSVELFNQIFGRQILLVLSLCFVNIIGSVHVLLLERNEELTERNSIAISVSINTIWIVSLLFLINC